MGIMNLFKKRTKLSFNYNVNNISEPEYIREYGIEITNKLENLFNSIEKIKHDKRISHSEKYRMINAVFETLEKTFNNFRESKILFQESDYKDIILKEEKEKERPSYMG